MLHYATASDVSTCDVGSGSPSSVSGGDSHAGLNDACDIISTRDKRVGQTPAPGSSGFTPKPAWPFAETECNDKDAQSAGIIGRSRSSCLFEMGFCNCALTNARNALQIPNF